MNTKEALEYIFGDKRPTGEHVEIAQETYKDLQHRKKKRRQQREADINAVTNRSFDRVHKMQYDGYYSLGHRK